MKTSIVTVKGQIVIPSSIRKKYKIKEGTKIYFREGNNEIKIIPVTSEMINKNFGILGTKGKLLENTQRRK